MTHPPKQPKVILVGAGFGGLWAAEKLADKPVDVLLIDKNNYHTFLPLLYQVAAAELEPERIAQSVRSIVRTDRNIDFAMAEVTAVDFEAQILTAGERDYPYDYLMLALGSTTHTFGTPGVEEHAFFLKTVEEGIALRNHILQSVELASLTDDPAEQRRLLTYVIIGGGPTGVEYAGALAELLYQPLEKDFKHLKLREKACVILVEAADQLLSGIGGGEYAIKRLESIGVEVRLEQMVSEISDGAVHLKSGETIETHSPIWTAGVRGVPLAEQWGLPIVRSGRVDVRPTLQVEGLDNVYVVGDLAAFPDEEGNLLPMVAQVAMQQGEQAAENIMNQIAGRELEEFEYFDKGSMATIGRNAAVAKIGKRIFTGFVAWVLWLGVHLFFLIGFRNRLGVLVNWAWNYIFYERVVRLILPLQKEV